MKTIFTAIVGSQAYGTATPTSDIDKKGIYCHDLSELMGFNYKEQIEYSKDYIEYEIKRFLELAKSANPTILELLFSPEDCIEITTPAFELLKENRNKFLTRQCGNSFGGYAIAQIKKARGLDKKMNYEKNRIERKTPLDFCYIYDGMVIKPLLEYLSTTAMIQNRCGLSQIDHMKDCYLLYYDFRNKHNGFKGIASEDSNELRLSSIPKDMPSECLLYYNKDGYSMHCRDYREYYNWLKERNTQRYIDSVTHGQKIDGKNLLHCRRLIDMALEIATEGTINVKRPNAKELLKIRRGEVSLQELLEKSEEDIKIIDELFSKSSLPKEINEEWLNNLLINIREIS